MSDIVLNDYVPSEDEPFMNERQKAYFRAKLIAWKNEILREARETLEILQQENANLPDLADRASSETDRSIELRARDLKIDHVYVDRYGQLLYIRCKPIGNEVSISDLQCIRFWNSVALTQIGLSRLLASSSHCNHDN